MKKKLLGRGGKKEREKGGRVSGKWGGLIEKERNKRLKTGEGEEKERNERGKSEKVMMGAKVEGEVERGEEEGEVRRTTSSTFGEVGGDGLEFLKVNSGLCLCFFFFSMNIYSFISS